MQSEGIVCHDGAAVLATTSRASTAPSVRRVGRLALRPLTGRRNILADRFLVRERHSQLQQLGESIGEVCCKFLTCRQHASAGLSMLQGDCATAG